MSKISVVINTLNEEKNLPRAISSIKDLADEIVVVDMHSDDKTASVAKKAGAKVFEYERVGYVEPARNFAISKAKGKWIFILDADETIPKSLATRIRKIAQKPKADYYGVARKNIIFGKWIKHSRWWPDHNIRFFKKGKVTWNEVIHAVPMTVGKGLDLPARESLAIVHKHYEAIEQYVERMNRYTTEHAKLLIKDGYKFSWKDLIKKPSEEFMSRYFAGEGYKDGIHGLSLSFLQAFSELVLYLKVWQAEKFKEKRISIGAAIGQMKEAEKDLHYWQADSLVRQKGGIVQKIRRRFRL